jgi:hypothetical protein
MQPSFLLKLTLSAVIFALTMTAITLWLFRSSFIGLTAMARGKTA